jgi:TetR/AcrR family transcriptional repressor of nem operon
MPYSAEHTRRTRQRILRTAAHAFRKQGFDGVSIPAVMRQAGLTHGGFYTHFPSKDALIASSFAEGFGESAERLLVRRDDASAAETLASVIRAYLSRAHRDTPDTGCVVPALTAEVARASSAVRASFTTALRDYARQLALLLPTSESADADQDAEALALLAGMAGALQLARAVDDPALSDAILRHARRLYGAAYSAAYARATPTAEPSAADQSRSDDHEHH